MTVNTENEFIDTNILVYAFNRTVGDKHLIAKNLILKLLKGQNGCLSIQVFQEFYVNITRKVANPIDAKTASQIIEDLSVWRIHNPEAKDVLQAIKIHQQYQISFWDALIIQAARQLNCTVIWSEDLSNRQVYAGVKILNPFILEF